MSIKTWREDNTTLAVQMQQGKANAFNFDLVNALNSALDEAQKDALAIVLCGNDKIFSAGFDINVLKNEGEEAFGRLVQQGAELLVRLYSFPTPVVMAARGHGIALGALVLLTGDMRFGANANAKYGLNETAIGLPLPNFGMALAKNRLSPNYLERSVLLSEMFEGQEAVSAGFLDHATEPQRALEQALQAAAQLKQLPAVQFKQTKLKLRQNAIKEMSQPDGSLAFTYQA